MALDADRLLALRIPARNLEYTDHDTLLYALALGAGLTGDLRFVHEDGQRVVPSFGQNLAFDDGWLTDGGIDLAHVVHGGLDLRFEAPFAPAGRAEVRSEITGLVDKGPGKAGIVLQETAVHQGGRRIFTSASTAFVRGGGGFGGSAGRAPETRPAPEGPAEITLDVATRPDQALLFRLLGDRNPLHALPGAARAAGFDRPILHGACTFGIACLTVLTRFCDGDPARMRRFAARFSGPIHPGETLRLAFWPRPGAVAFSATAAERGTPVLDGGLAEITGGPGG